MLSDGRRAELHNIAQALDGRFVSAALLKEVLTEYDSLKRTERDAESEKTSWAMRAASYQELLRLVVEQMQEDQFNLELARAVTIIDGLVEDGYDQQGWESQDSRLVEAEQFVEDHPTWLSMGIELRERGEF